MVTEAWPPGTRIADRYRIDGVIGRGGMGIVYRASHDALSRAVAVKMLRAELVETASARARFEREARVASTLAHPAAVTVHDFGDHEGVPYFVMELVEGPTLSARIAGHASGMDPARATTITAELADVVAAAHDIGLVHRDLTPSNVILEPTDNGERLRVLDFGLAFHVDRDTAERLTREGIVVGTPAYLSPEQARGAEVGPATDIYALGCVLHELLTGSPPFGGTEMEILTKQMFAPAPDLIGHGRARSIPTALDSLRRKMLDKTAERRPSAHEIRDALVALDPDAKKERVRAGTDGFLGGRARRMVEAARPTSETEKERAAEIEIGIIGAVDPALLLGLTAVGFTPFVITPEEPIGEQTSAIYAPGILEAGLAALAEDLPEDLRVVTDADRGDLTRLTSMMRAGAADVVLRPVTAADLARKLRRVGRERRA